MHHHGVARSPADATWRLGEKAGYNTKVKPDRNVVVTHACSAQAETKIKLGATAGLRLLPEGKADIILNEVRKVLKTYPFQLDDATGVTILDGETSNA